MAAYKGAGSLNSMLQHLAARPLEGKWLDEVNYLGNMESRVATTRTPALNKAIQGAVIAYKDLHRFWLSDSPWRWKRMVFKATVEETLLSGLFGVVLSKHALTTLKQRLLKWARAV